MDGCLEVYFILLSLGIKSNADILEEFYDQIVKGCYRVAKGSNLTKELIQEVCLSIMKMDNQRLNELYPEDCYKYFNGIANTLFWCDPNFHKKFRGDELELNTAINIEQVEDKFNQYEYMVELDLDPNESLWVRTYLRFDGNYTWIANTTGISRQHCSKRINYIKKKYKK